MKILKGKTPKDTRDFDGDYPQDLDPTDVVEIFETPLTGSYNWDYTVQDNRIKKLYELGKELNWNVESDLDWSPEFEGISMEEFDFEDNQWANHPVYKEMPRWKSKEFFHDLNCWATSQFLHGEQGALLVASQLASCAPTYNAKLYAASQTFDEARHVEVFNRYLQEKIGIHYPINPSLKLLLDKILTDERWDLKFIGMQIIIEGLALAAFQMLKSITKDPLLKQLLHYVVRDEARHVTFGINYLEEYIKTLTPEEIEERAQFAYEACVISRERLINTKSEQRFLGMSEDEARAFQMETKSFEMFRNFLFSRVIPNLSRIGLLTDTVRPKFEALGLLEYEHAPDDFECDWAEMKKPLEKFGQIPTSL